MMWLKRVWHRIQNKNMDRLNTWQKYYDLEMAFCISQNTSKHLAGLDWLIVRYSDRPNYRNFKTSSFFTLTRQVLIATTRTVFFIDSSTETIVRLTLLQFSYLTFSFSNWGFELFLFVAYFVSWWQEYMRRQTRRHFKSWLR